MHEKYRAPLKLLFSFSINPKVYEQMIDQAVYNLSTSGVWKLLQYPYSSKENSHLLISTHLLPTNPMQTKSQIASPYAMEKICEFFKYQLDKIGSMYDVLRGNPETNSAAGIFLTIGPEPTENVAAGRTIIGTQSRKKKRIKP